VIEAQAQDKAKLIVVDPRFTRSAADVRLLRADRVFFAPTLRFSPGVINYLLRTTSAAGVCQALHKQFHRQRGLPFENGIFSGYDEAKPPTARLVATSLTRSYARYDETFSHERCV